MDIIQKLVQSLQIFPGVGRKTAEKYALTLLEKKNKKGIELGHQLIETLSNVQYCPICHFYAQSDGSCKFCDDPTRDNSSILVVHHTFDILHIEKMQMYKGLYHVLNGQLSPIERIGPNDLNINDLLDRVNKISPTELILATNATIEGQATAHYIAQHVIKNKKDIKITQLASGVPLGSELEYIDVHTLSHALNQRKIYDTGE